MTQRELNFAIAGMAAMCIAVILVDMYVIWSDYKEVIKSNPKRIIDGTATVVAVEERVKV